MLFGRGPAAPALSFTLRLILFAVAERGRTFKDELSSAPKKNAKEFAAWRARVLRSGGAAAAVFEQLAAAGHDIPATEEEWQRVGKKYGTSSEGGRNWGRDKHNVKAVRKQLMEQTESLPFCSKLLSVLHLWDRSECMHAYRWELCVVHVCSLDIVRSCRTHCPIDQPKLV